MFQSRGYDGAQANGREPLSACEKEIIVCVLKGLTNKQIADALCISTHTVITHRRNIAAKLQIHSAEGLTIYAIVHKIGRTFGNQRDDRQIKEKNRTVLIKKFLYLSKLLHFDE